VQLEWYYAVRGVQVGPISESEVGHRFKGDGFPANALVWRVGFKDWQKISDVPEFAPKPGPLPLPATPPASPNSKPKALASLASKWLLPAIFIALTTLYSVDLLRHQSVGYNLIIGVLTGLFLVGVGSRLARIFRRKAPVWARRAGIAIYWLFTAVALIELGIGAYAAYEGFPHILHVAAETAGLYWVVGLGARRALR
jgi:hypothetical protein